MIWLPVTMIIYDIKAEQGFSLFHQVRHFGPCYSGLIALSVSDHKRCLNVLYCRAKKVVMSNRRVTKMQNPSFCLWGTFLNYKLRQIKCTKCSCMWSIFSSKHCVEMSWDNDLTEDWRVEDLELRLFEAAMTAVCGSIMLDWRSIVGGGGRGRCHRLGLVLVRQAEEARCQSSCYRRSPHSSYSGASVLRWRTPSHTVCSGSLPCPSTKPDPPEELC